MDILCRRCGKSINRIDTSENSIKQVFLTGVFNIHCDQCGLNFGITQIVNNRFGVEVGYEL